jgi:hypothetical protein
MSVESTSTKGISGLSLRPSESRAMMFRPLLTALFPILLDIGKDIIVLT